MKQLPVLPPHLLELCRGLRRGQTLSEERLWKLLRGRQLGGFKFRRQHGIPNPATNGEYGNFILDFYCHEKKLAIELDGGGHAEPEQIAYDQARTQALKSLGIAEIRFWNSEVSENLEGVLEAIWSKLHELDGAS
ncbi:MAG: endonuclease domain-containing protein [Meiothermus sp.]|nr:endonuclease domain-containing protein [Meiothermus sp.]